jgi:hypothetical protein
MCLIDSPKKIAQIREMEETKKKRKSKHKSEFELQNGDFILGADPGQTDFGICIAQVERKDEKQQFKICELDVFSVGSKKLNEACSKLVQILRAHPSWLKCKFIVIEQQPTSVSHAGNTANVVLSYAFMTAIQCLSDSSPTFVFASPGAKFNIFVKSF